MKAYVLHDGELEFIWSWEPEPQPSSEAPIAVPAEISCDAAISNSTSPVERPALEPLVENLEALSALDRAVRVRQKSDAQDTEQQVKPGLAHTPATESQVETSDNWIQAAIAAIGGVVRQQEEEIQKLMEQAGRTENEAKSWSAQTRTLQSQVDILNERIQTFLAKLDSTVRDQADEAIRGWHGSKTSSAP
jgi:uncharacterized protein involved in exopolysaccharide biosynthesis